MYSDDETAFVKGENVDECVTKLNVLATGMNTWCVTKKIKINVDKKEAMIMKRQQFTDPHVPIRIGKNIVECKEVSKVLGVYIDHKLDLNAHIDKAYKKCSGMIAMLRKAKFLPTKTLEEVYHKIVIPKVTYGMLVWDTCSQNKVEKNRKATC